MSKIISILGSTGSIGTQTLDVARQYPEDIKVGALAAGSNVDALLEQIREFSPELVCVWNPDKAAELEKRLHDIAGELSGKAPAVMSGLEGLTACATLPCADMVVTAVVGMIGIRPTMAAIRAGKDIALANKETLVTAGHLIMPLAKEHGVRILPVDSEHSAIFQCLSGEKNITSPDGNVFDNPIEKILLTASGGPFRGKDRKFLETVRLEDALKHPNWAMGRKITIDSATMVNKGLEVMEARWLFDVSLDQIQVVVQPQSLIHSMVEFQDGSVMAQLGTPDMRLPIAYALFYPERRPLSGQKLDFYALSGVTFEKPDLDTFVGLRMAFEAARIGGSMPVVFNAANERAVAMFLNREIGFTDITDLIRQAMDRHVPAADPDVDAILEIERETYDWIDSNRRN